MASTINEVMTHDPRTVESGDALAQAARAMAEADVGAVIVVDDGRVTGVLTDRDIVVRAIARGRDPVSTKVSEIVSAQVATLSPNQGVEQAIGLMRERDVRRIPVVQDARPVGIVSLGDLAVERNPDSALADVSAATPNR